MNRLFVVKKPLFISSNNFLNRVKRRYGVKKGGFSGTLDPFAKGTLIVAFGQYTKLFNYLKKTPKVYRATIFLGADSETMDIEKISKVTPLNRFDNSQIEEVVESFKGKIKQIPPKYSAKKIDGVRAYKLARDNLDIEMKEIEVEVYDIRVTNYSHPFLSIEAEVSEGTYIRSLGVDIAHKLGVDGALTYLERVREGEFIYENEKSLNPLNYLNVEKNFYLGDTQNLSLGRKLKKEEFKNQNSGKYVVEFENYFAIIEIEKSGKVNYLLNRIKKCL
jgi:tRNA pseudouridine55 synthase